MKILFLSTELPGPGDLRRAVFNRGMVHALGKAHEVRVVRPVSWVERVTRPHVRAPRDAAGAAVLYPTYYYVPRALHSERGTFMWWSVRRALRQVTRRWIPDVVISYWAYPDGEAARRFAAGLRVPLVQIVGGSDVLMPRESVRSHVTRVLESAAAVVTVSSHLNRAVQALGIDPARVHTIYRPVDRERFSPGSKQDARNALGLPADASIILWVGRFDSVKGLPVLLDAARLLKSRIVRLRICLVGDGPEMAAIRRRTSALRLADVVTFAGPVAHEHLAGWYRAADVTVLPSLSEGTPNVLLESVACGTPFVASRVGGIPEIADPARDRLVPCGDATALAGALADTLTARSAARGPRLLPATPLAYSQALTDVCERAQQTAYASRHPTMVAPRRWRQAAHRAARMIVPRRWFVSAGGRDCRSVCLTFDDGPDLEHTPKVLNVLAEHGVKATFFVRGDRAAAHPALIRRIRDEGHDIGHHSWSHSSPDRTSARQLTAEARRTRALLRTIAGVNASLFRPPHGKLTVVKLLGLWILGQTVVLWNTDPGDVFQDSEASLNRWFDQHPLREGDLVLLHERAAGLPVALRRVIPATRARGLRFSRVSEWAMPAAGASPPAGAA